MTGVRGPPRVSPFPSAYPLLSLRPWAYPWVYRGAAIPAQVTWNKNGNWLVSCSRDQTIKLYDIRTMKDMATFKVCMAAFLAFCCGDRGPAPRGSGYRYGSKLSSRSVFVTIRVSVAPRLARPT